MTQRERWTVYPLLILALGAALKDKLMRVVECDEVVCRQFTIVGADGTPRVRMGPSAAGDGTLELLDAQGRTVVLLGAAERGSLGGVHDPLAVQPAAPVLLPGAGDGGVVVLFDNRQSSKVVVARDATGRAFVGALPFGRTEPQPLTP